MSQYLHSVISPNYSFMPVLENKCRLKFYKFLKPHENNFMIKLSGLGTGLALVGIKLIFRIAGLAESIFKSLIHFLGAPFSNNCSLLYGIAFLIKAVEHSFTICLFPIWSICCIFCEIFGMAINPAIYIQSNINILTGSTIVSLTCPSLSNLPEGDFKTTYEKIKNASESKKYKELFDLPENYTEDNLDRAFRKLCLKIHPDKNQAITEEANLLVKFVGDVKEALLERAAS